ncbi:hypothetical protein MTDSW087_05458 [Methylobacterium dankookense]|uniref:Uncharacterized protein n=2 Tax=Methylobacterium dankookense TaxID=560405 RepID=A0A564G5A2_9HYPH|nr:hypothetical protein IFDJLNFL_1489 [Methylobacterium dankookense]VUF15713.1 hypothetical protein MTDSW087_05458 [Methylobacterium dankookense]
MRKYVFFVAVLSCVASIQTAEARRHDRGGAHCRLGKIYRPSLGICESRAAFRSAMRDLAPAAEPSRRALRRMARAERRQHRREMREAARLEARSRVARLLPTRPYPQRDEAETVAEGPATTSALPSPGAEALACPVTPSAGFSEIPWTPSGPFSLNPLPRYARADLDWRR